MNRILKIKIGTGVLLLLTMFTFVFPIVQFSDISISLLDMVGTSSDIKELMDEFGTSSELISGEMNSYFIFGLILFVLPAIECILLFVIKGKIAFTVGLAGTLVNNVLGFIFYDKISSTISLINKAISFLSMGMEIERVGGTVAYWCILHLLIVAISLFGFLKGEQVFNTKSNFRPMSQILPEEIGAAVRRSPELVGGEAKRQITLKETAIPRYKNQENSYPAPPADELSVQPFFGGLAGSSGMFKGKIRLLDKDEQLVIGIDEQICDVVLEYSLDGAGYCSIHYDTIMKEYQLKPLCTESVFLKSGQPLGKDRIYCLPRGTVIMFKDKKSIFQLV
ncbi:MAG: hypothetical protein HFE76_05200 [Firmicutes bacterium]|nr:hypothetical protein [Bacillota bacterium]